MKLNGIDLAGYSAKGNEATFTLEGVTMQDALNLNGQTLTVTQDEETYAIYAGYTVVEIEDQADGTIAMRAMRKLNDETEAAIIGLDQSVSLLTAKLDTVETAASDAATSATEAKASADNAAAKAEEAKQTAEQAGTSPSVKAAAVMFVNASTTLTNSTLGDVRELIEDFKPGAEYPKGAIRRYDGKYYRMAQAINSTTSQTYQPGTGTESLYTLIDLAADGIRIWRKVTDATNSFALNEKAHYPDAEGPVYVSKRDGNDSEPTKDEWWALDEE